MACSALKDALQRSPDSVLPKRSAEVVPADYSIFIASRLPKIGSNRSWQAPPNDPVTAVSLTVRRLAVRAAFDPVLA